MCMVKKFIWLFLGSLQFLSVSPDYMVPAAAPSINVSHSHPGPCIEGLVGIIDITPILRPIAKSDIQGLIIHQDDTYAQGCLYKIAIWDYG